MGGGVVLGSSFAGYVPLASQIPTRVPHYSQLPPCGHPAITDTSLLWTKEKSLAETIKKYMKTALAITDTCYYGHTDTSPGPKLKFSLFFSCYNEHFRHVFKNWCDLNSCIWQNNSKQG